MAFGNVNDLFQTQANINQLAFSDPFNPVNLNGGQWGVNPNLLTPAYTGIYRPQWQGAQGQGQLAGAYGSFWSGANQSLNPLAADRFGGYMNGISPYNQTAGDYSALGGRPMGSAMSFAQNAAVPFAAQLLLQKTGWRMGSAIGRGVLGDFATGAIGSGLGGGVGALSGFVGGAIGAMALPAAAVYAADQGFRHYATQRMGTQAFLSNLGDQNFGPGVGNVVTGQGISRYQAATLAKGLDVAGSKDWMLDGRDYEKIADISMKSGMMDNTQFKNFLPKIKQIAASVKFIVQAAGLPDMQEAIELMAKLKTQGADITAATRVVNSFSRASTIGGVSTGYLMNTVGDQASYMFSSAGMTPYVGANVAANQYAAYRNAYRQGLMSPALVAQMGGLQGMTQSYTSGVLQMAQTPISDIQGYLLSRGQKGVGSSLMHDISQFGQLASGNISKTMGGMILGRSAYETEMTKHPEALLSSIMSSYSQMDPVLFGKDKNGQVSPEQVAAALTASGMSPDAVKALIMSSMQRYDPAAAAGRLHGDKASLVKLQMQMLQEAKQNYGILNPVVSTYESAKSGVSSWAANLMSGPSGIAASLGDLFEGAMTSARYGKGSFTFGESGEGAKISESAINKLSGSGVPWLTSTNSSALAGKFLRNGGSGLIKQLNAARAKMTPADGAVWDTLMAKGDKMTAADKRKLVDLANKDAGVAGSKAMGQFIDLASTSAPGAMLASTKENYGKDFLGRFNTTDLAGNKKLHEYQDLMYNPGITTKTSFKSTLADQEDNFVGESFSQGYFRSVNGDMSHMDLATAEKLGGAMGLKYKPGGNAEDFIHRVQDKTSSYAAMSLAGGTTYVSSVSDALAKALSYKGKDKDAYYTKLGAESGMDLNDFKGRVDILRKDLGKEGTSNEVQGLKQIAKLIASGKTDFLKGLSTDNTTGNADLSGLSNSGKATYEKSFISDHVDAFKNEKVLSNMRHGVAQGLISPDTYTKTMLAMQEKQDSKKFSAAVDVFAASVKLQTDTTKKERAADRTALDNARGASIAANTVT